MRVSEIRVKRIHVNQGLGVIITKTTFKYKLRHLYLYHYIGNVLENIYPSQLQITDVFYGRPSEFQAEPASYSASILFTSICYQYVNELS